MLQVSSFDIKGCGSYGLDKIWILKPYKWILKIRKKKGIKIMCLSDKSTLKNWGNSIQPSLKNCLEKKGNKITKKNNKLNNNYKVFHLKLKTLKCLPLKRRHNYSRYYKPKIKTQCWKIIKWNLVSWVCLQIQLEATGSLYSKIKIL